MVLERRSGAELKELAIAEGMKTMRQVGRQKVIDGITTPEEIIRVLFAEE
jgi:type IV pilus assembly protein PilB